MNIYDKISRMTGPESYDEKMYLLLNTDKFRTNIYETRDLGEGMSLVKQLIDNYWKPRFLLDHTTRCAYEFMDGNEYLVTVTDDDIVWPTLKDLPENYLHIARQKSFRYPSFVYGYTNGVAEVSWQLNPDGRYFQDDDGFGMTSDHEFDIYGFIDREGTVVVPFRAIKDNAELAVLRAEAERIVQQRG